MPEKQKKLSGQFEPNPKRYREASRPHESPEAAEEAVKAFFDEVADLRTKYQIGDLLLIWCVSFTSTNGTERGSMGVSGMGNQALWESMAAFAYGGEKASREARIQELLSAREPSL